MTTIDAWLSTPDNSADKLVYGLEDDLKDQRTAYIKWTLAVSLFCLIPLFGLAVAMTELYSPPWLCIILGIFVSWLLIRAHLVYLAAYSYIIGLIVAFSVSLAYYGPNMAIYFAFFGPLLISSLLLQGAQIWRIALLSLFVQWAITLHDVGLTAGIPLGLMPGAICLLFATVSTIKDSNFLERMAWAFDIQYKDARRAELFYAQREELQATLLALSHANSRLELANAKLEVAQRRAESASQAKSVFMSNTSHELRTPLNVVIGYSSAMLNMPHMFDNVVLPEVYKPYVQLIQDNGQYLVGLINDVLDLSKIEAGKLELHCEPVSLPPLFQGIIATSIGLLKDKPLQIRPDFSDDLPLIWGDSMRVRQILLNLMSNAIKFTETGSITLRAWVEDTMVHMSVIDTGIGIPESSLQTIFDRFQQAAHDTDRRYGGTGLGLDISKQLSQMHGGDLTVQSVVGQGSTFTFTLPIARPEQIAPKAASPASAPATENPLNTEGVSDVAYSILLVEDEVSTREMFHHLLQSEGYVVIDTHDGAQALDIAEGLLPDLILLDVNLPNMNGWDVLQALKQNPDTAAIPVVLCTVDDARDRALQLGAACYVRKPVVPGDLLISIRGIFATQSREVQPT